MPEIRGKQMLMKVKKQTTNPCQHFDSQSRTWAQDEHKSANEVTKQASVQMILQTSLENTS